MKRLLFAGVLCGALLLPGVATAHPVDGPVFPPDSHPYGRSYSWWFSEYEKWFNEIPTPLNPLVDPDSPLNCASRGPVVFGGPFGSGEGCTARSWQAFAFGGPGWECSTAEGLGDTFAELRACAIDNFAIDFGPPGFRVTVRVDGQLVRAPWRWVFVSQGRIIDFPDDNIWGAVPGPSKSVSKGYLLMLRPMTPGHHRIVMRVFVDGEYQFAVPWQVRVLGHH
ncbi:MAG TPA: hypothetical protein VIB62_04380 [Actinomycetota bacterium]|jgi:hypothetical protein